jgi:hypothetical protein
MLSPSHAQRPSHLPGRPGRIRVAITVFVLAAAAGQAAELDEALRTIRQVSVDGRENEAVARAWQQVRGQKARSLPRILAAVDEASPLAANWLRAAVDAIAQRELAAGRPLPTKDLEQFVLDTGHDPRGRRLALLWLRRADPVAAERLVPRFLHDPGVELRRDAVARLLQEAADLPDTNQKARRQRYLQALDAARDRDQVDTIAAALERLGHQVDLPRHFGFLMRWQLIGPFDNADRRGFDTAYPPEEELDLEAEYPGRDGTVGWSGFRTQDRYGMVDLNRPLGRQKEVLAYAWTQFTSDRPREVELRLGCKNAWKLWLNGELVFSRNEYHRGMQMDQYRMAVTLRSGQNDILIKVCQNEQEESWTEEWEFQLRVCDETGTAVLSTTRPLP